MRHAGAALRPIVTLFGLLLVWWCATRLSAVPSFMLPGSLGRRPGPGLADGALLFWSTLTTLSPRSCSAYLLGTILGAGPGAAPGVFAAAAALADAAPVDQPGDSGFRLAPMLVLWFGFGMSSKVVMAVLVIFFPITAAFYDGLRRTESAGWSSRGPWTPRPGRSCGMSG